MPRDADRNGAPAMPPRAGQILNGTAGRVFTANTYRAGYEWLHGAIAEGCVIHHIFPQSRQFVAFFNRLGINVHNPLFLQEVEGKVHASISRGYNELWLAFIRDHPDATITEVFAFARAVMARYGLSTPF